MFELKSFNYSVDNMGRDLEFLNYFEINLKVLSDFGNDSIENKLKRINNELNLESFLIQNDFRLITSLTSTNSDNYYSYKIYNKNNSSSKLKIVYSNNPELEEITLLGTNFRNSVFKPIYRVIGNKTTNKLANFETIRKFIN